LAGAESLKGEAGSEIIWGGEAQNNKRIFGQDGGERRELKGHACKLRAEAEGNTLAGGWEEKKRI